MSRNHGKEVAAAQRGTLIPASEANPCHCRARVRLHIGQRRTGGTWTQCSKTPRPGKNTCRWHAHLEE